MSKNIGIGVERKDAYDKVTGKGIFTSDLKFKDMLYAKVLRSPYAHAKIVNIDTSEAEKLPGVKVVATYKNTTQKLFNTSATMVFTVPEEKPVIDQTIFTDTVRYVGDEIAAVAAESEKIAEEAIKLIKVEYEKLDIVLDCLEAQEDSSIKIHPVEGDINNSPGNPAVLTMGDFEKAWENCEYKVERKFKLPIQKQAQMETHSAVANYKKTGELIVYSTTQTVHPTKQILGHLFELPESKIRIVNPPYVGGGFGVRIGCSAKAEPIASVLSMMTERPVKICYTREEDFTASDTRHGGYVYVKLGADKNGRFKALKLNAVLDTGAYCSFGVEVPGVLGAVSVSTYNIENIDYEGHAVYTNKVPAGAMRGFGSPQGTFAVERAVDEMAEKLNMDPIEIRKMNIMKVNDPWVLPYECKSTALSECMDKVKESIGWEEKRGKNKGGKGYLKRGVGIGVGTHVSNSAPFCVDYDTIYVRLEGDGSLHIASGAPEIGTAITTSIPQMAAEAVGVNLKDVHLVFGDTDATPFDIGAHASRSLYAVGTALLKASKDLKNEVLEYVSNKWNVEVEKLDIVDGQIKGLDRALSLKEVAQKAHLDRKRFMKIGQTTPPNAPPWHAQAVEVEVDTETGMIDIIKIAAAHDVGKAINPPVVEGQIEGGVAMGIGYAISEEMTVNERGEAYNHSFARYMLPTFNKIPEIDTIIVESNDPTGPFGAKGIGECGNIPTAPAIVAAVEDALNVKFNEIPLTPERVLKAIEESNL